ncbi:MAG: Hpt domain-containing protein [Bdellovibrionales bacterium]
MSFEDLLKSLQAEYLASLPGKVLALQEELENASVVNLREMFHKLKGTGRTYGLPEVSELAKAAESVCLESPHDAIAAAALSIDLLRDIHSARVGQRVLVLDNDPRFDQLLKLVPSRFHN